MEKKVNTNFLNWEDEDDHKNRWGNLSGDLGCAFDYISSSAVIEWLCKENTVPNELDAGGRINTYRGFSRLCNWFSIIPQLVLFDNIYLSIGSFYKKHIDMSVLKKLGFVKEFPRPHERRYYEMYELLLPAVKGYLGIQLEKIAGKRFEEIWTQQGQDARAELKNYTGLAEWLFREFSKDACGMQPNEGELIPRLGFELAFRFFDFIEFACHGQGHFVDAPIPYYSSILKVNKNSTKVSIENQPVGDSAFSLYQMATARALNFQPVINTFDDVIRLRNDKNITKIRELLSVYRSVVPTNNEMMVDEITKEITNAKSKLENLKFTESSIYTYGVTSLSFVPVLGNIISILNASVQLYKDLATRKNGWIYFGIK